VYERSSYTFSTPEIDDRHQHIVSMINHGGFTESEAVVKFMLEFNLQQMQQAKENRFAEFDMHLDTSTEAEISRDQ
jgi:hypothetical protein